MNNYFVGILALAIVLVSGYLVFSTPPHDEMQWTEKGDIPSADMQWTEKSGQPNESSETTTGMVPSAGSSITVSYTNAGFSPNTVTVKKGQTVMFLNETSGPMWVGADEHPSHTMYSGTSRTTHCAADYTGEKPFDQCGSGATYTFTFTKPGTWTYHNHAAAQAQGTIVVTE